MEATDRPAGGEGLPSAETDSQVPLAKAPTQTEVNSSILDSSVSQDAPLRQAATQVEPEAASSPSAAPRPRLQVESGPESPSSAPTKADSSVQLVIPGAQPPDSSLPMPFEYSEAVSSGSVDKPPDSNRIKNSRESNPETAALNSDVEPDGLPASLVQYPVQANDSETEASVPGAKETDSFADKKDGEAAQDLTIGTNERGGPTKAEAGPPAAQHFVPQEGAHAGSTSPQAAGTTQNPGRVAGANPSEGDQADTQKVVSSARLTQQAGNAEMQVKLRSETLGPINVHTTVKGSDIGASIRVEVRDTQVMLATELPQLEQALNERSLRVAHLDVLQGSVTGGQSNGHQAGNSFGSPSEPRQGFSSYSTGQTYTSLPETPTVPEDPEFGLSTTRINLRV
jgi:flagellar hook-length control protein FliK